MAKESLKWNTVKATERQLKAVELRMAGRTYQEIATELGYAHPSGAHAAVQSVLKEARSEAAEEMRELELDRLNKLLSGVWEKALAGDVKAVHAVLAIIDKRSKLAGLYSPTQYAEVVNVHYVNDWQSVGAKDLADLKEQENEQNQEQIQEREDFEIVYEDWGDGFE